ncbi:unnamed protein product, partial [Effrenium voratum]
GDVSPLAGIQLRLDQLSEQVDCCLVQLMKLEPASTLKESRRSRRHKMSQADGILPAIPSDKPFLDEDDASASSSSLGPPGSNASFAARSPMPSDDWDAPGEGRNTDTTLRSQMVRFRDCDEKSEPAVSEAKTRRKGKHVRNMDVKIAWQMHATSEESSPAEGQSSLHPMMRLLNGITCTERLWELLDDPASSRLALWISMFFRVTVVTSIIVSNLQNLEEEVLNPVLAAVLETCFDTIYLLEFICRIGSAPAKAAYLFDPYNWADMLSACGIFIRVGVGFVIRRPASADEQSVQVLLLFVLPVARLLKLLRYFESFRLLVDACKNSLASLPVMMYTMALIILVSANAIYLAESRSTIPSLPHCYWLAIVTITSVGFGDYVPRTPAGHVIVGMLSLVGVLFLALPVGTIGREFTESWENRARVLLLTRVRKCLWKWGYSVKDLRVLFEYIDADSNGVLSLPEFLE